MTNKRKWTYSQSVKRLIKSKKKYAIYMKTADQPIYEFDF
jgi:hypothetical protein